VKEVEAGSVQINPPSTGSNLFWGFFGAGKAAMLEVKHNLRLPDVMMNPHS